MSRGGRGLTSPLTGYSWMDSLPTARSPNFPPQLCGVDVTKLRDYKVRWLVCIDLIIIYSNSIKTHSNTPHGVFTSIPITSYTNSFLLCGFHTFLFHISSSIILAIISLPCVSILNLLVLYNPPTHLVSIVLCKLTLVLNSPLVSLFLLDLWSILILLKCD